VGAFERWSVCAANLRKYFEHWTVFVAPPWNRIAAMHNFLPEREHVEVLAGFGEARLVRTLDMKYELRGGSAEDREAALDWIRKFFPDLVGFAAFPNCRPMDRG